MSGPHKKVFIKKEKSMRLVRKGEEAQKAPSSVKVPAPPIAEPESLFEFFCPYCGHKIPTRRSKSGQQIHCSVCDQSVVVPNPSASEISVSAPSEPTPADPSFKFYCVYCGQRLSSVMSDCGKPTTCPGCATTFDIPSEPPDEERFDENHNPVAFIYFCPHCGRRHSAIDAWIGQPFQCPGCENSLTVPPPLEQE